VRAYISNKPGKTILNGGATHLGKITAGGLYGPRWERGMFKLNRNKELAEERRV